jgi:hypothetical protein
MTKQTVRGIPVPDVVDPDAVPADMAALAQFLDPGALVPFDPALAALSGRIVFLVEGDADPASLSIPPRRGSIFLDRMRGRIYLPLAQLVDGVSTLSWYRIGTDTDSVIADLTAAFEGVIRSPLPGLQVQADTQNLTLTGVPAGQATQFWVTTVTFAVPFLVPPTVVACNADSILSPDTVIGVQKVTTDDFQVRVSNPFVPFYYGAQASVAYTAVGS